MTETHYGPSNHKGGRLTEERHARRATFSASNSSTYSRSSTAQQSGAVKAAEACAHSDITGSAPARMCRIAAVRWQNKAANLACELLDCGKLHAYVHMSQGISSTLSPHASESEKHVLGCHVVYDVSKNMCMAQVCRRQSACWTVSPSRAAEYAINRNVPDRCVSIKHSAWTHRLSYSRYVSL